MAPSPNKKPGLHARVPSGGGATREVAYNGECSVCGGTHYGSFKCPYTPEEQARFERMRAAKAKQLKAAVAAREATRVKDTEDPTSLIREMAAIIEHEYGGCKFAGIVERADRLTGVCSPCAEDNHPCTCGRV
jgi:hypothetical protein